MAFWSASYGTGSHQVLSHSHSAPESIFVVRSEPIYDDASGHPCSVVFGMGLVLPHSGWQVVGVQEYCVVNTGICCHLYAEVPVLLMK